MKNDHPKFWCFNRFRDASLINTESLHWKGPFSWPGFEQMNNLHSIPDCSGVYLFTFEYKNGFILRSVGITNSMKRRFSQHKREYMSGKYTVLDVEAANNGERKEIWHGWKYAKMHKDEFLHQKNQILKAVEKELNSYRLFVSQIEERRKQERIESAIALNAYLSKEPWGDLIDRGMALRGRYCSEIPIEIKNQCSAKVFGLPEILEI